MTAGSAAAPAAAPHAPVRRALLFGNFVTGCGIMVVPGTLNDLAQSLQISVALAGQLFAVGAATVCFGAPLLAGWVSGFDRRKLLALSLVGYAVGHALCAAMPSETSGRPNFAFAEARMKSHASASSQPPPSAKPLTAAITGT